MAALKADEIKSLIILSEWFSSLSSNIFYEEKNPLHEYSKRISRKSRPLGKDGKNKEKDIARNVWL